tara:strand:- start:670 stop:2289 length:1620 start_codon:yes stop_codon:yes gene_type:complete
LIIVSCEDENSDIDINNVDNNDDGKNKKYSLNIVASPQDGGIITPQSGTFNSGENVGITAKPNEGYSFDGWTGDASGTNLSIQIIMDGDKNITGNFSKKDTDSDGVPDNIDKCPDTKLGETVGPNGCVNLEIIWEKSYTSMEQQGSESIKEIVSNIDGTFLLGGDLSYGYTSGNTNSLVQNLFFTKIDFDGNELWSNSWNYGSPSYYGNNVQLQSLRKTSNNNYLISTYVQSNSGKGITLRIDQNGDKICYDQSGWDQRAFIFDAVEIDNKTISLGVSRKGSGKDIATVYYGHAVSSQSCNLIRDVDVESNLIRDNGFHDAVELDNGDLAILGTTMNVSDNISKLWLLRFIPGKLPMSYLDPKDQWINWEKSYNPPVSLAFAQSIYKNKLIKTKDNSLLLLGKAYNASADEGSYVIKVSSENGQVIWEKSIFTNSSRLNDMAETENGDIILVGENYSKEIDNNNNEVTINKGGFVMKIDSNGNILWEENIRNTNLNSVSCDTGACEATILKTIKYIGNNQFLLGGKSKGNSWLLKTNFN